MIDLILLGLIGLVVYVCVKSVNHGDDHKCIYCIAENVINKIKGWVK